MQRPYTRHRLTINLRRLEFPGASGFKRKSREVLARSGRFELGICNGSLGIDSDAYRHLNLALDGPKARGWYLRQNVLGHFALDHRAPGWQISLWISFHGWSWGRLLRSHRGWRRRLLFMTTQLQDRDDTNKNHQRDDQRNYAQLGRWRFSSCIGGAVAGKETWGFGLSFPPRSALTSSSVHRRVGSTLGTPPQYRGTVAESIPDNRNCTGQFIPARRV